LLNETTGLLIGLESTTDMSNAQPTAPRRPIESNFIGWYSNQHDATRRSLRPSLV